MLNGRIYKNPPDPAFERTLRPETVKVLIYLDEPFLQQVLRIIGIVGIPETNRIHLRGEPVIKFFLHWLVALNTTFNKVGFGNTIVAFELQEFYIYIFKSRKGLRFVAKIKPAHQRLSSCD